MPRLKAYGLLDCDDESVEILNPPFDQFKPQKRPQQEEQVDEENKPNHQQLVEINEHGCVRSGRAEPSDEVSFRHLEELYHAGSTKHHRTESNYRGKRGSASNRLTRMFRKDDDDKCEMESNISRRRGTSSKRRNSPCHNHLAEEEISISWHRNNNNVQGQQRNQQGGKKELGSTNKSGDDIVTRRNRSCRSNNNATQRRTRSGSLSRRRGRMQRTKRRVNSADNIPILSPPKKNRDVVEIDCSNSITSEVTMLMSNTINSPNNRTKDISSIRKKNNSLDLDIKSLETSAAILSKHNVKKMKNETDDHTQQNKGLSTKPSSRLRVKDRNRQRSRSRSRREPRTRQARDRSNTDRRRRMIT